jgi:ApbE superfamily uncharacterized protein (UPF0280 family)
MLKYRTTLLSSNQHDIFSYEVVYKETSLFIKSSKNFSSQILRNLVAIRKPLENYIKNHPEFLTSLKPIEVEKNSPKIVSYIAETAKIVKTVGPMASVAGTIAEFLGEKMLKVIEKENLKKFLIIENGGDIFAYIDEPITVGIYAGEGSVFTNKLGIKISVLNQPLGICTSSGNIGHSLSFGKADAVVIISNSASFSDALATATCNLVKTEKDVEPAIEFAKSFEQTLFVCIIKNKNIGVWTKTHNIELVYL